MVIECAKERKSETKLVQIANWSDRLCITSHKYNFFSSISIAFLLTSHTMQSAHSIFGGAFHTLFFCFFDAIVCECVFFFSRLCFHWKMSSSDMILVGTFCIHQLFHYFSSKNAFFFCFVVATPFYILLISNFCFALSLSLCVWLGVSMCTIMKPFRKELQFSICQYSTSPWIIFDAWWYFRFRMKSISLFGLMLSWIGKYCHCRIAFFAPIHLILGFLMFRLWYGFWLD